MGPQDYVWGKKLSQKVLSSIFNRSRFLTEKIRSFCQKLPNKLLKLQPVWQLGTISVITFLIDVFNFWFFSDSNWKKIGRLSKTTFFQGNSLSKTIFYGFLCLVFLKLWAETFVPWARELFRRLSKIFVLFYGRIATFTFIKLKYVSFFSCIFFQTSIPVFPESWPFLSGSVNEAAFIFFHRRFSSVERSSSIFFFKFSIVFRNFDRKKNGFLAEFFQQVVETAFILSRAEVRGIYFFNFERN